MSHETLSSSADTFSISTADVHQKDANQFLLQEERDPFAEMLEKANAPDARMQRLHASAEQAAAIVEGISQKHPNSLSPRVVSHIRGLFTKVVMLDRDAKNLVGTLYEGVVANDSIPQSEKVSTVLAISQLPRLEGVSTAFQKYFETLEKKSGLLRELKSRDPSLATTLSIQEEERRERENERAKPRVEMAPAASLPGGKEVPGVTVPPRTKTDSIGQ